MIFLTVSLLLEVKNIYKYKIKIFLEKLSRYTGLKHQILQIYKFWVRIKFMWKVNEKVIKSK